MNRKLLVAGGAVVLGVMSGPALAADPIKIEVGGFMTQWVGVAQQSSTYDAALNTATASSDHKSFDIKGDSEIHFTGSTTLDNGIEVGVVVELEAERHQTNNTDESYLYLSSPVLGRLAVGYHGSAAWEAHNAAPDVGFGNMDADTGDWIVRPDAVQFLNMTGLNYETAQRVSYMSPSFSGFAVGGSYSPDTANANNNMPTKGNSRAAYTAVLTYGGEFEGVGIAADVGYGRRSSGAAANEQKQTGWQFGLNLTYEGFTLGGSYFRVREDKLAALDTTSNHGYLYDIGLAYETGPYGISVNYLSSENEGTIADPGKDKVKSLVFSGAYNLGPGVDLKGSVLRIKYDDETTAAADNNRGWAGLVGVALTF